MSTLTVVRHAQARPFQLHSDSLSDLGEQQSRALRAYWSANQITFDEVHCGTLTRHSQTASLAIDHPPLLDPAWNEYDAEAILKTHPSTFPDNRAFQKFFEASMTRWLSGEIPGAESYDAFRTRILNALHRLQTGPSNRRVLLFTSGGPIGLLVQIALNTPPQSFLDLNWRIRNASITEFLFTPNRLTLDSFNAVPHLAPPLHSFR